MSRDRSRPPVFRIWSRLTPALISAALLSLSFHPVQLDGLIWVALVPLLIWLAGPGPSVRGVLLGCWLIGFFYHFYIMTPLFSLSWWGWGTTREGPQAYFSYQTLFLLIVCLAVAIWAGIVMAGVGLLMRRQLGRPWLALLWVPAVWVVILEYVGHATVFGLSWGLLGNRLHDAAHLRQLASLTGIYGLSALVVFVNTAIALLVVHLRRHAQIGRGAGQAAALLTALLTVLSLSWLYGAGQLRAGDAKPRAEQRVALLQTGGDPFAPPAFTEEGMLRSAARLLEDARAQPADLVVLPESIWLRPVSLDGTSPPWAAGLLSRAELGEQLADELPPDSERVLVFGADTIHQGLMYNTTVFWTRHGLLGTYFKRRLVPFAEYRPALVGRFAPPNRLHGPGFAYHEGAGPQLVYVNRVPIGTFICQEVLFPHLSRETVRHGAQLLVTTGNDRVFLSPLVAEEHARLAVLRAIEHRRYVVRVMKGGISAVIDPAGRQLARAPLDAERLLTATVVPRSEQTPYTRFGNWIVWLGSAVILVGLILPPAKSS